MELLKVLHFSVYSGIESESEVVYLANEQLVGDFLLIYSAKTKCTTAVVPSVPSDPTSTMGQPALPLYRATRTTQPVL